MDKVYIYKCDSYEDSKVKKVMEKLLSSFKVLDQIKPKSKVAIKVNLVSAMEPDKAVTTHPVLLKYLVKYLKDKKCDVVIGDSPGGIYTKGHLNHVYEVTKMNETGAKLNDNFNITSTVFNEAKVLKTFDYTAYLDDADYIINFCKLKTHGMMAMSCGVKNLFGTIPGTTKPEYHYRFPNRKDFADMLVDLNLFFKPIVTIVDAVVGMEGNGPTMGIPRNIGAVIASENVFALDFICAKLIGLSINDVETINASLERNLFDPDKISLNDDINKYIINDFDVKKDLNSIAFYENSKGVINQIFSKVSNKIFSNKPMPNKNKCVGCGKCASICPAKAITIINKKAVINRDKCIKCYCCQEFCPFGAMVVKTSFVSKIINNKKGKKK